MAEVSNMAGVIVESVHDIVEPFVQIADGASQLIGMFA